MPNAKLITSDPKVMMGKPVVAGTRITVELILEKLAHGQSEDQILEAHPRVSGKRFERLSPLWRTLCRSDGPIFVSRSPLEARSR